MKARLTILRITLSASLAAAALCAGIAQAQAPEPAPASSAPASRQRIQLVDLAQNLAVHPASAGLIDPLIQPAVQDINREEEIGMQGMQRPSPLGGE